ncbi:hypothetical protein LJB93_03185, partial [Desulfovibrio sp. OttesenSCG-928-F07]|nr:hypothetical protein [Desulfovibrio sp. OttesenSCG-928-F07]
SGDQQINEMQVPEFQAAAKPLLLQLKHAGNYDIVVANPPYRKSGSGRTPASPARERALFGNRANLAAFVHAANLLLGSGGYFCCIFPYERRVDLLNALQAGGFVPSNVLTVYTKSTEEARFVLVCACKAAGGAMLTTANVYSAELEVAANFKQSTLLLYKNTKEQIYTKEALEFCSFLAVK